MDVGVSIEPQEFLIWWQNTFPEMSAVFAPYIRIRIAKRLRPASVFCLRMAYVEDRLRECVDKGLCGPEKLYWLPNDSLDLMINGFAQLRMDSLVKHLADFGSMPDYVVASVADSLHNRLNDHCKPLLHELVSDFENATGDSVESLRRPFRRSDVANETEETLSINISVRKLLEFVECADNELIELEQLTMNADVGANDVPLETKRRCLAFKNDIERRLSRFEGILPQIAETWLLDAFELIERRPQYFGR